MSLVLPPVATMTALRARKFIVGLVLSMLPSERKLFSGVAAPGMICGLYCAVMPITRPSFSSGDGSRINAGHFVIQQKLHALGARARFQRPDHARSAGGVGTFQPRALGPERMIFPRRRVAGGRRAMIVRRLIGKLDAIGE